MLNRRGFCALATALAAGCSSVQKVVPTYQAFQSRDQVTGLSSLGSVGNVLATGGEGAYPTAEDRKFELNLGFHMAPDGRQGAFFVVNYRGEGWVYLQEGPSALTVEADGVLYRFTGVKSDYKVFAGRRVFESATFPVREMDLRAITVARSARVRISHREGRVDAELTEENREHLRRFLTEEVQARVATASARELRH